MEENDGCMIRFRLVFNDRHLLDKSQRSQGLRRCWFHLEPGIKNIGDLASEIRKCFDLRHRIVLFLDDFVLPSFESTCIITDKDIILVKMEDAKTKKTRKKPCDDGNSQENLQEKESHDKEILNSCLENSVHIDHLGDVCLTKRKRKGSKKLRDAKGQDDESIHETDFEPNNNTDMRKKEQASSEMIQEEDVVASVGRHGYISFQPQEHAIQQANETQVDSVPISDGILPLPKPEVMSSTINLENTYKHGAGKDNWEEALIKESWNEHDASTADQSNSWPQWISNNSATALPWSFKQPNAPFAGWNNERANWAPRRYVNNRFPNRNIPNWNINRNKATWNPN